MAGPDYFLPGDDSPGILPNFLEPISPRLAGHYIAAYVPSHGRLLDPFCQSPTLAQEAVGREVLLSHFSPLHVLTVESLLHLTSPQELDAATTRLGDFPKLGTPLRESIARLYASHCHRCRSPITVDRFRWESGILKQKEFSCDYCGFQGLAPTEDLDQERALKVEPQGFQYHYLLERIAPPGDEERRLIRNLLQLYTPRNLSALVDISLKIESFFQDDIIRRAMQIMLLLTIARTSKFGADALPHFSTGRLRPPLTFQEQNAWMVFEDAYRTLRHLAMEPINDVVAQVSQESTRSLAHHLPRQSTDLIIAVPPLPDRNHWALLYLWTGWILGREKAQVLKPLLRVRTGDWDWYRRAMTTALRSLAPTLAPTGRMVLILSQANYPWATNLLLAAAEAGLKTESFLYQTRESPTETSAQAKAGSKPEVGYEDYRLILSTEETPLVPGPTVAQRLRQVAYLAIQGILEEWGDALPSNYLRLAVWQSWNRQDLLRQAVKEGIPAKDLEKELEEAWTEGLARQIFSAAEAQEDLHWLADRSEKIPPLLDRVEEAARQVVEKSSPLSFHQAQEEVYRQFPGSLTPPRDMVETALLAYGREAEGMLWPSSTDIQKEKAKVLDILQQLGERLDFKVISSSETKHSDLEWEEGEKTLYRFVIRSTARVAEFYRWAIESKGPERLLIAIPDTLSDLLRLKLAWSPILRQRLLSAGWDFVKFGLIREMAAQEKIERHDLAKIIGLLPPAETKEAQLPLLL
ncbi:MAG: hypothetical protein HYX86_02015 [Chloroflexi bacterium]|nr:hypothetical protein [Chloroflexota bacterium]